MRSKSKDKGKGEMIVGELILDRYLYVKKNRIFVENFDMRIKLTPKSNRNTLRMNRRIKINEK